MKKYSWKLLFFGFLLLGWITFANPYGPLSWNVPQSNHFTVTYPHLSYKIFFAVLEPWLKPQAKRTVLELPDRPIVEPGRLASAA